MAVANSYRHPRCYASAVGGCGTKLSNEHPLPESILRQVAENGLVEMMGLPGQGPGEVKRYGVKALGRKVLCEAHNKQLSRYDTEAGRFMTALRCGVRNEGALGIRRVDGDRLERLMLKALCGLVVGAMGEARGVQADWVPPTDWLGYLFSETELPGKLGMYFIGKVGAPLHDGFEVAVVSNPTDGPYGLRLTLAGLPLLLAMRLPSGPVPEDSLLIGAVYRPVRLDYFSGGSRARRTVELVWRSPGDGAIVTYA